MEKLWIRWLKNMEVWMRLSTKWPSISKKWTRDKTNWCQNSSINFSKESRSMPTPFSSTPWDSIIYLELAFMAAILQMTGPKVMKSQSRSRISHNRKPHQKCRSRKNRNTFLTIVILKTKTRRFQNTMTRIAIILGTANLPPLNNSRKINWTSSLRKKSKI